MLSRNMKHGIATIAVASAVVAAGAGWAVAGSSEGQDSDALRLALEAPKPTVAVGELQSEILENFALFRERAAGNMPEHIAEQVGSPERYGRDPALARAIKTVTGTGWVIPGDGYLCLAVPDPIDGYGTSCVPTEVAVRQGLALTLSGNIPNGQAAETLVIADGVRAREGSTEVDADLGVVSAFTDAAGDLQVSSK